MRNKDRAVFRKMRKGLRIPLAQLAKETGLYRTKLSDWENGRLDLTPDEERSIGEAIDGVLVKRGIPGVVTAEQAAEDSRNGSVLARLRGQSGVTQMELTKKTKINQSAISSFEKGHADLPSDEVGKLFRALDAILEERAERAKREGANFSKKVSLASLGKAQLQDAEAQKKQLLEEYEAKLRKIDGEIARLKKGEWTH